MSLAHLNWSKKVGSDGNNLRAAQVCRARRRRTQHAPPDAVNLMLAKRWIRRTSKWQSSSGKDANNALAILVELQSLLRLNHRFKVLQQTAAGLLALQRVALVLLVAKLSCGPPAHQPERLHPVVHKGPIVCEGPERAHFGAAHVEVRPIARDLHVGASGFVHLLS